MPQKILYLQAVQLFRHGLIEIVSVNENGTAVMKSDLPFGKYYVKEIATDEHYVLSDTKYPVVFEYAGQDTTTVKSK